MLQLPRRELVAEIKDRLKTEKVIALLGKVGSGRRFLCHQALRESDLAKRSCVLSPVNLRNELAEEFPQQNIFVLPNLEKLLSEGDREPFFRILFFLKHEPSAKLLTTCHPGFFSYFQEFFFKPEEVRPLTLEIPDLTEQEKREALEEHESAFDKISKEDCLGILDTPFGLNLLVSAELKEPCKASELKSQLLEQHKSKATPESWGHEAFEEWELIAWIEEEFRLAGGDGQTFSRQLKPQLNLRRALLTWLKELEENHFQKTIPLFAACVRSDSMSKSFRYDVLGYLLRSSRSLDYIKACESELLGRRSELLPRLANFAAALQGEGEEIWSALFEIFLHNRFALEPEDRPLIEGLLHKWLDSDATSHFERDSYPEAKRLADFASVRLVSENSTATTAKETSFGQQESASIVIKPEKEFSLESAPEYLGGVNLELYWLSKRPPEKVDTNTVLGYLEQYRKLPRLDMEQLQIEFGKGILACLCCGKTWDHLDQEQKDWVLEELRFQLNKSDYDWSEASRERPLAESPEASVGEALASIFHRTLDTSYELQVSELLIIGLTHPNWEIRSSFAWAIGSKVRSNDDFIGRACNALLIEDGLPLKAKESSQTVRRAFRSLALAPEVGLLPPQKPQREGCAILIDSLLRLSNSRRQWRKWVCFSEYRDRENSQDLFLEHSYQSASIICDTNAELKERVLAWLHVLRCPMLVTKVYWEKLFEILFRKDIPTRPRFATLVAQPDVLWRLTKQLDALPVSLVRMAELILDEEPTDFPELAKNLETLYAAGFDIPDFVLKYLHQLFSRWIPRTPTALGTTEKEKARVLFFLDKMFENNLAGSLELTQDYLTLHY